MTISEVIRTYLLSVSDLSALVGTSIWPERADQDVTGDYLIYTIDLQPAEVQLNGPDILIEATAQFIAVSESYDRAFEIAEAVRSALSYFKGIMGGTSGLRVEACWWNQTQGAALPRETPEQGVFGVLATFGIHYLPA